MTYEQALLSSQVLPRLQVFDPHFAGSLPLGIAVEASDIDILCHAADSVAFSRTLWRHFSDRPLFAMHQWRTRERPVVARFVSDGWTFEIFGSPQPVREQMGWRHFDIEARLLSLCGEDLRQAVRAARRQSLKTEAAFATVLGVPGDPYAALLELQTWSDAALLDIWASRPVP